MTEERVGHLYKISCDSLVSRGKTGDLLKSYYLMRCHELTKSYGLPSKQFSPLSRCSFCCTKWTTGKYETEVKPVKLSKGQKRRIKRSQETIASSNDSILLHSNALERTCLLCNHVTKIPLQKPENTLLKNVFIPVTETSAPIPSKDQNNKNSLKDKNIAKHKVAEQKPTMNVYNSTHDVFSLANKSNSIGTKVPEKVIKNNKKKKDKFAGLRKEAVLAAAKMAISKDVQHQKQNKLNLFLKPSK